MYFSPHLMSFFFIHEVINYLSFSAGEVIGGCSYVGGCGSIIAGDFV